MHQRKPSGLLSDPFLQLPDRDGVRVVWFTEIEEGTHSVTLDDGRTFKADDRLLTRLVDRDGNPRRVHRHEADVRPLPRGRTGYRVMSTSDEGWTISDEYTLAPALPEGTGARIMLVSDHQLSANAATAMELAAATFGRVDAVVFAGDLADVPDRASDWFDDPCAVFATMQGHGRATDRGGHLSPGGEILQHAPLFPAIGNHEVQGRVTAGNRLSMMAVPRNVAEDAYVDGPDRERWVEDNSWSIRTYEELFTLPTNPSGHGRWYAVTIGNVRLITLFHTRAWRRPDASPDPSQRTVNSRFQESAASLEDPLAQGHGSFIFEAVVPGSEQYEWLVSELQSPERLAAEYTVVQLHEGPYGLGGNVEPPFCDPERIEERDDDGRLIGVRYEYSNARNEFRKHVVPLLEAAGVQLVYSGHSHVWNRFVSGGTHYLEASHTGTTHGTHTRRNGNARPVPPAPWRSEEYTAFGDPHGAEPVVPNVAPLTYPEGDPMPYVSDRDLLTFQLFDSHTGEVSTWLARVGESLPEPVLVDRFTLAPSRQR